MRQLFCLSIIALVLIFTSCQNESNLVNTENSGTRLNSSNEPNWIGLPKAKEAKLQKIHSVNEFITVADGGELVITDTYLSTNGNTVEVYSSLKFDPGCVKQNGNISMELDDETGVSTFLPAQVFNFPAIINQRITGFDLSNVNIDDIGFYYIKTDGTFEEMQYDDLIIDVQTGTIEIVNARIPHFSRYGIGT